MSEKKNWFKRHKVLAVVGFVMLLGIIVSASGGDNPSSSGENAANRSDTSESITAETPKKEEPAVPAEYKAALNKAKTYADTMDMSKAGIYDQLVSEHGEKFSKEAAQYAIDTVQVDWKANALAKAKTYQDTMDMSPSAIRDQLTSSYGEKFTAEEADYAIKHLND